MMIKLIILCGIISITNGSQNDAEEYLLYLIKHNKFESASSVLDRLIYDSQDNKDKLHFYSLTQAYIAQSQSNHDLAINIYTDLLINNQEGFNSSIIDTIKYNYSLSLFEIGNYYKSLSILSNLDIDIAQQLLYQNLLLLSEQDLAVNNQLNDTQIKNIHYLRTQLKNPKMSTLLSSLMPGLGQVYSKHYFDGAQSFLMNLIGATFVVISVDKYGLPFSKESDFDDTAKVGVVLTGESLFYLANLISAKKTTYYYNQKKKNEFIINNGGYSNPILISNYY